MITLRTLASTRAWPGLAIMPLLYLFATAAFAVEPPKDGTSDRKAMMTNGHLGDCRSCHGKSDPNRFMVDPERSRVVFQADNFGFGAVIGEFHRIEGGFSYNSANPDKVFAVATIRANSVDFGDRLLNAVVRERFLNVEKFPDMTFVAKTIQRTGTNVGKISGDFTMLGVTRPVTLDVRFNNVGRHPLTGENSAGFTATGSLKRSDFGETLGLPAIGDQISFEITLLGKNLQ
jgi:polyisoprenoid-binding protein YceI